MKKMTTIASILLAALSAHAQEKDDDPGLRKTLLAARRLELQAQILRLEADRLRIEARKARVRAQIVRIDDELKKMNAARRPGPKPTVLAILMDKAIELARQRQGRMRPDQLRRWSLQYQRMVKPWLERVVDPGARSRIGRALADERVKAKELAATRRRLEMLIRRARTSGVELPQATIVLIEMADRRRGDYLLQVLAEQGLRWALTRSAPGTPAPSGRRPGGKVRATYYYLRG